MEKGPRTSVSVSSSVTIKPAKLLLPALPDVDDDDDDEEVAELFPAWLVSVVAAMPAVAKPLARDDVLIPLMAAWTVAVALAILAATTLSRWALSSTRHTAVISEGGHLPAQCGCVPHGHR